MMMMTATRMMIWFVEKLWVVGSCCDNLQMQKVVICVIVEVVSWLLGVNEECERLLGVFFGFFWWDACTVGVQDCHDALMII
jgi:hypothetical protein